MWAQDTNTIFLMNNFNNSLYIVRGNVTDIHLVSNNYYLSEIRGISNNDIYLFGTKMPDRKLAIIKWNGGSFEFYDSDVNPVNPNTVRGCIVNSNEIWAGSQGGIVKFDGNNMVEYNYADSLLLLDNLFLSVENKIQYIGYKFLDINTIQQSLYEFQDTSIVRIFDYVTNYTNTITYLASMAGYKMGMKKSIHPNSLCIEYFTGSSFTPYFCFNDKIIDTWRSVSGATGWTGNNSQDFMLLVHSGNQPIFNNHFVGIVHWNGTRVSSEIGLDRYMTPEPYNAFMLYCINENSYLLLCPYSEVLQNSTLYIASKK
jgi:hypothetical protein